MMKIWLWLIFIVFISLYNLAYGFLPENWRNIIWIRFGWVIVATLSALVSISQTVKENLNYSYASVSQEGSILKSKNFPWKINKTKLDGGTVYIIEEYHGDSLTVNVKGNNKAASAEIYNAIDGVGIRFIGVGFGNPIVEDSFVVEIKK